MASSVPCPFPTLNCILGGFPNISAGKESTCNAGDTGNMGSIPGWGRSSEKVMATHSSILAWKTPWAEEPGRLQSKGSQRVRRDWATKHSFHQMPPLTLYSLFTSLSCQYSLGRPMRLYSSLSSISIQPCSLSSLSSLGLNEKQYSSSYFTAKNKGE